MKKVLGVYKLDFGVPEAIWVIEVEDFPAVVTMDAHGTACTMSSGLNPKSSRPADDLTPSLVKPFPLTGLAGGITSASPFAVSPGNDSPHVIF